MGEMGNAGYGETNFFLASWLNCVARSQKLKNPFSVLQACPYFTYHKSQKQIKTRELCKIIFSLQSLRYVQPPFTKAGEKCQKICLI